MKLITLLFILATVILVPPANAGQMSIPGGWTVDITYCTNGFTAKVNVPASITANVFHRVLIISTYPESWLLGGEVMRYFSDASGSGGFSISKDFYWRTPQAVGTPVTTRGIRFENLTLVNASNADADVVGACEIPPMPIEIAQHIEVDGRMNKDYDQTGAVYCRSGGIEVLYSIDGDPREGRRALYASNMQIATIGIPALYPVVLASSTDGYVLYRLSDGKFLFTAPGLEVGKVYDFEWLGC